MTFLFLALGKWGGTELNVFRACLPKTLPPVFSVLIPHDTFFAALKHCTIALLSCAVRDVNSTLKYVEEGGRAFNGGV